MKEIILIPLSDTPKKDGTKKYPDISDTIKRERTTILIMSYDTAEQLQTVLYFLEPITISHREEPGLYGEQKRSYITVQV